MTEVAGPRSANGYWGTQIVVTALLGAGSVAASYVLLVVKPDEPGGAVLIALIGIALLTTFAWTVDTATRSTPLERALFAWAIMQHEAAGHGNDALAMSDAARARDGTLDADRIRTLQALRPGNPYPTHLPVSDAARGEPATVRRDTGPDRTRLALAALFLALTGLYFSCIPPVFILGWPFQLAASIMAVFAIVPRGRGRRLGIAAASVSVLGTIVTLVLLLVRILQALT